MRSVVRRDADLDTVSDHDLDSVSLHSSGKYAPYRDVIITLNLHGTATQNPVDQALQLN